MRQKIIWMGFIAIFQLSAIRSQSVVNSSGGSLSSDNQKLDYAIGEVATTTLSTTNNHVTQGLLQPLSVMVNANELFDPQFTLSAFPNPVCNELIIQTSYTQFTQLEIMDIQGKIIRKMDWQNQPVEFGTIPSGVYLVRLYDNLFSKTIKIVKI